MRVGFVGVGAMGWPMVERLVGAGHQVAAYARRDEVKAKLAESGAIVAPTAASVADDAQLVLLCPFTDGQVRAIAIDEGVLSGMAPGSVLGVHTTGSPATVRSLAAAAPPGVAVIDCPVSGGPANIAAGSITLFVGGAEPDVVKATPALIAYGDPILHLGPLGSGQLVKLINNALFAAHLQLAAEASRLASELGVDPAAAAAAVARGSGDSRAIEILSGRRDMGSLRTYIDKDVDVLRTVAAELGLDLGLLADTIAKGPEPFGT